MGCIHGYTLITNGYVLNLSLLSTGVGDFSVWEFSGNPVYYCSYDYFAANDNTAIHLVLFSLEEPYETQLSHVTYWLNLLKALTLPQDSIGEDGNDTFVTSVVQVFISRASNIRFIFTSLMFLIASVTLVWFVLIRCVFLPFSSFWRSHPAAPGGRPRGDACRPC